MTTADNKAVFRRFYEETWNTGDVGILDKVLAPDFINHEIADGDVSHRELYKRAVIETHLGLPDFALAIDDLIAEGLWWSLPCQGGRANIVSPCHQ